MKKLFISMMALAAFVACQSEFDGVDVETPIVNGGNYGGSHTLYAEVGVGGETKATYGDDLKAMWEENDQIALLQEHADYGKTFGVVNELTIKGGWGTNTASFNGDISVDAIDPRVYHIAYPAEAVSFNVVSSLTKSSDSAYTTQTADSTFDGTMGYYSASADYKYTYTSTMSLTVPTVQSGKWTPYMYASTSEAVNSQAIGAKTLTTLTGAIAIRAFEADGVTPKQLKSITITSSDAALAGAFSATSESSATVRHTGAYTSDSYSTVSDSDINTGIVNWPGANKGRAAADELLASKAQAYEPTSTSVTKAMSLAFVGTEKSVTAENLDAVAADVDGNYTYYLNVAPATVGALTVVAVAVDGTRHTETFDNQTFRAGARRGFLMKWASAKFSCGSINTWYNDYATNKSTELAGSTIYAYNLKVEGVSASDVLALGLMVDGTLYDAQSGVLEVAQVKAEGLASGNHHTVYAYAKVLENGVEREFKAAAGTYMVTSIPTATATIRSSYSNNGNKDVTNSIDGRAVQVTAGLSDSAIPSSLIQSCKLRYNSASSNITFGTTNTFTWTPASYDCSVEVTLANGYVCSTPTYATHVTGIPYTMNVTANDSWNAWTVDGNVKWGDSSSVRLGYNVESLGNWANDSTSIEKSFDLPADTKVVAKCAGSATGTRVVLSSSSTTFTFKVSGNTVGSTDSGKNSTKEFNYNSTVTMSASNPKITCVNSKSTNTACSRITSLSIFYE